MKINRGIFAVGAVLLLVVASPAETVRWTGGAGDGLWSSPANWSGGALPTDGDDIIINNATVNWDVTDASGFLPGGLTIDLTGTATLNTLAVIRVNGALFNVGPDAALSGNGFWDLLNGIFVFEAGAGATMSNWEQKGNNSFTFNLNAAGFEALTPGALRFGGGATIADATYIADLKDYEGDTGIIPLLTFSGGESLTAAEFQQATLEILNAGNYTANLQWNEATRTIELNIAGLQRLDLILYHN